MELLKKITKNGCLGSNERRMLVRKQAGIMKVDVNTNIEAQLTALTHKLNMVEARLGAKQVLYCSLCQGDHHTDQCSLIMETVSFVSDYGRQMTDNTSLGVRLQWGNNNGAQWGPPA